MFDLLQGYRECARVTQQHARTFHLASYALGPVRRRGAFAVYAFCRRIDDTVDEAEGAPRDVLEQHIARLREQLDAVCSHRALDDPQLLALRDTIRRFGIERRPFDELIDGVASDIDLAQIETEEELDRYCYLVAGTVGLIMARLFGVRTESALTHAIDLGKAMQLTNILRDVREDLLEKHRVYLPANRLREAGIAADDLRASTASPALRGVVAGLAARARVLYASADRGIPMLVSPSGRAATAIMSDSYAEILSVLEEKNWDVLAGRASVSSGRRIALAVRAIRRTASAP